MGVLSLTSDRAIGPYLRGRLWIAGIRDATSLVTALDVLEVILMDTPQEALAEKRRSLDVAVAVAEARAGIVDRASWGLSPEQQAATAPLLGGA
jgi:hypothetical protein